MIKKRRKTIVYFETYMLMAENAKLPEVKRQALVDILNSQLDDSGCYIDFSEFTWQLIKLFGVSDKELELAQKLAMTQAEIKEEIRCN